MNSGCMLGHGRTTSSSEPHGTGAVHSHAPIGRNPLAIRCGRPPIYRAEHEIACRTNVPERAGNLPLRLRKSIPFRAEIRQSRSEIHRAQRNVLPARRPAVHPERPVGPLLLSTEDLVGRARANVRSLMHPLHLLDVVRPSRARPAERLARPPAAPRVAAPSPSVLSRHAFHDRSGPETSRPTRPRVPRQSR